MKYHNVAADFMVNNVFFYCIFFLFFILYSRVSVTCQFLTSCSFIDIFLTLTPQLCCVELSITSREQHNYALLPIWPFKKNTF